MRETEIKMRLIWERAKKEKKEKDLQKKMIK